MSQSNFACYIVRLMGLPDDEAARAGLRQALQQAGFSTTVADADGIPHRLAADTYALTSVQAQSDVERLAQALGQQALGQCLTVEALPRDEYFTARRLARAEARNAPQHD
ncbi:type V toxin-antitoxin system endoribonuclease antitoxin GhoS [Edwardsiella tarda]|uniref:type V toxin-antitoxin system endoribonuclease antitoxin GhoS n=1 Tax=Edwardsiella tarda TaxID=636 RepID=UPI00351C27AA